MRLRLFDETFPHIPDPSLKSPPENSSSEPGYIMNELEKLKSYLTNVELQLYEANENIADLLEKVGSYWQPMTQF